MKKVRIYELAKELNLKSARMLEILAQLGVPVKGVVGTIEEETATLVKEIVDKEKTALAGAKKEPAKAAKAAPKAVPEKEKEKPTPVSVEPVIIAEKPKAFLESVTYPAFAKQFSLKQHELNTIMLKNGIPVRECGLLDPDDADLILEVSSRLLQAKEADRALALLLRATAKPDASGEVYARLGTVSAFGTYTGR